MDNIPSTGPPPVGRRPGKLVIVGSGIKSISQFTLEAVAHIQQADKVFYCVADPSRPGCQTLEATDVLLRNRPIATDCHVVMFQVGAVGDLGFNFKGFKNTKFKTLVDRLIQDYGKDHPVVHYIASQNSIAAPVI